MEIFQEYITKRKKIIKKCIHKKNHNFTNLLLIIYNLNEIKNLNFFLSFFIRFF